jgi:hypothetical protein
MWRSIPAVRGLICAAMILVFLFATAPSSRAEGTEKCSDAESYSYCLNDGGVFQVGSGERVSYGADEEEGADEIADSIEAQASACSFDPYGCIRGLKDAVRNGRIREALIRQAAIRQVLAYSKGR